MVRIKRHRTLADDLDLLLVDICVRLGFCNSLSGEQILLNNEEITDDLFADTVLLAEGMNPVYDVKWHRELSKQFRDRFGKVSVSAADYKSA